MPRHRSNFPKPGTLAHRQRLAALSDLDNITSLNQIDGISPEAREERAQNSRRKVMARKRQESIAEKEVEMLFMLWEAKDALTM